MVKNHASWKGEEDNSLTPCASKIPLTILMVNTGNKIGRLYVPAQEVLFPSSDDSNDFYLVGISVDYFVED